MENRLASLEIRSRRGNGSKAERHDVLTGPRDTLTQLLHGLRLEGVEYGRCLLRAPWALAFAEQPAARFHFVMGGGAWLRTRASAWTRLAPGDAVLLPRGTFHAVAGGSQPPQAALDALPVVQAGDGVAGVHSVSAETATDAMFCGAMQFNVDVDHPLRRMLPDVIRASELAQRDANVPVLLQAMEREVAARRAGSSAILARLADALAASIIRSWAEHACDAAGSGWLAAVHCPRIGKVVAAIHADPQRDWSVAALAEVMGASRSTFTQTFTRAVGMSPARYITQLKMMQARSWIAQEGMRVSVAAQRLGYESEASFSRAFKRVIGHSPAHSRSAA